MILQVRVRRYRCDGCGHVWRQDMSAAAAPRAKLTRGALRWALEGLVVAHLSMARIAQALGVAWHTANTAVLAEGAQMLIGDPRRFDDVHVLGVDEHVWRHARTGGKYVTVIIDLTPVRAGTGPARLLDVVEGRSKQAFKTWLAKRPLPWRDRLEVVAMDGFTGFKTATTEELPEAVAVMDPFHVVRLAADALDRCRRRVQQDLHAHRGRKNDPLYRARRTLHTGADLLTERQRQRLTALFDGQDHVQVNATWGIYQRMIGAYRDPGHARGKQQMTALIDSLRQGVPAALVEFADPGQDLEEAGRGRPGLLRSTRDIQRADRGDQRPARAPARDRTGLPQHRQLHRPLPARSRRLQTGATPSSAMSRSWCLTVAVRTTSSEPTVSGFAPVRATIDSLRRGYRVRPEEERAASQRSAASPWAR